MIITETVFIKMNGKHISKYRDKGYICNVNDIIEVKIEDVAKSSKIRIKTKCDECGKLTETNYNNYKETITTNESGKRLPTTVLQFNRVERPIHPTQKPVDLLEWIIKTYSNPNDIVLDSCMGVGSTGIACMNTERKFIGIEINELFYQQAYSSLIQ